MATEKTELIDLISHGVDLKNRRLYFGTNIDMSDDESIHSSFTMGSVDAAIRAMHRMVVDSPNKPIEIHMSSYGGDVYAMLRLHDEILACPCQIKFYGGGAIMSAATWIMAVCDERYLHKNATVMIHDGSEESIGRHTDVQINALESKRLMDILYNVYAENSRMPVEFWQDIIQRDVYLSAEEAIQLGLADKIVEPKKRGNLRRARQAHLRSKVDKQEFKKLLHNIYARINRVKVPKIELNKPVKEPVDPKVDIDNSVLQEPNHDEASVNVDKPTELIIPASKSD